jgi:ubiquinone/menaquinone biosynthesis C-methylase UbiE
MERDILQNLISAVFSKSLQARRMLERGATDTLWLPVAEIVSLARSLEPVVTPEQIAQATTDLAGRQWFKPRIEQRIADGYAGWAAGYDEEPNPLIIIEEPVVLELLGNVGGKDVLDAGSGTGRYALRLAHTGARVAALDATEEMLALARAKAAAAGAKIDFRIGGVTKLPYPDASFDVVVCALMLCHLPDVTPAMTEFARVLRPGGKLVVSDFHPFCLLIGWRTVYRRPEASYYIENYVHSIADHVRALRSNGFTLRDLREELIDERLLPAFPEDVVERFRDLPLALVIAADRAS